MNIIFGFGSTEEQYREKIKRQIEVLVESCIAGKFKTLNDVWFSEDILKDIEKKVKEFAEKHPNATECQAEACNLTLNEYNLMKLES